MGVGAAATISGVPAATIRPLASPGTQVDHPVGGLDHIQVVLDHDEGKVAQVRQAVDDVQEAGDVREMQGRRSARP